MNTCDFDISARNYFTITKHYSRTLYVPHRTGVYLYSMDIIVIVVVKIVVKIMEMSKKRKTLKKLETKNTNPQPNYGIYTI